MVSVCASWLFFWQTWVQNCLERRLSFLIYFDLGVASRNFDNSSNENNTNKSKELKQDLDPTIYYVTSVNVP